MLTVMDTEVPRLRTALRDLVALSTIPAMWVGREPSAIAVGVVDLLAESLQLEFAFVRLRDPGGGDAVAATRGSAWAAFPDWLSSRLALGGPLSHREIIPVRPPRSTSFSFPWPRITPRRRSRTRASFASGRGRRKPFVRRATSSR